MRQYPWMPLEVERVCRKIHKAHQANAPYLGDPGEERAYNQVLEWIEQEYPTPRTDTGDLLEGIFYETGRGE